MERPAETMGSSPSPAMVLLLFAVILLSCFSAAKPDLQSDKLSLLAFREAVGRRSLDWNASSSPCYWTGIACEAGRVVSISLLPGVGLLGQIPDGVLANLTGLRTLHLPLNSLSGSLPRDLASLTDLRNLSLQNNRFSGEIPSSISSLKNLVQLNLAGNLLSGAIPSGVGDLKLLRSLSLEENRLTGQIPDFNLAFDHLNVSYNRLKGSIPPRLRTMPEAAFLGLDVCGSPLQPCIDDDSTSAPTPSPDGGKKKKKNLPAGVIAGIVIGSIFALPLGLLLLYDLFMIGFILYFGIKVHLRNREREAYFEEMTRNEAEIARAGTVAAA